MTILSKDARFDIALLIISLANGVVAKVQPITTMPILLNNIYN